MAKINTPESSNMAHYEYDDKAKKLTVGFKNGGLYHYHDVPSDVVDKLGSAESKGKFLIGYIRGKFQHSKAEE